MVGRDNTHGPPNCKFWLARARKPRPRGPGGSPGGAGAKRSTLDWGSLDLSGGADLDGCVVLIGLLLALGAAWLLAELFVPLLLFVAYWLILKGLTSVANDRHACEGRLPLAILWGVLWATLYTAPLAGLVALARWILTRS